MDGTDVFMFLLMKLLVSEMNVFEISEVESVFGQFVDTQMVCLMSELGVFKLTYCSVWKTRHCGFLIGMGYIIIQENTFLTKINNTV